jgi:PAS domain S-box-containing protein
MCGLSLLSKSWLCSERLGWRMSDLDDSNLELKRVFHGESKMDQERSNRAHDELEQLVRERTSELSALNGELLREIAERERAEIELTLVKDELAADLKTMIRLHELSTRLLVTTELPSLLEEILDATIELLKADFGNVQICNPESKALEIVAQRGFNQDFLDYFSNVSGESAACGRAMAYGKRVVIPNIETDPGFAPHRQIAASAGFRAVQCTPLFSRSGEPLGMISTHFRLPHQPSEHDLRFSDLYAHLAAELIERERNSDALNASENRFRRYFELGLVGMAITSPTKDILEVNDELCRILGYERHELLQLTWAEITHPDDLLTDVEQFNRVMAGEIDEYTLDKRWTRKDCQIIDSTMSAKCVRRADGSVDYFVGLVQDITERKRAEEKLLRNEIYLSEGQRLTHTASWAWNVLTGEVYWSDELFRIHGLDPHEEKPSYPDVLRYIHPDDRPRVQKIFEDAVCYQREYEVAYRIVWSDGTIRNVNNLAHPVFNENGTVLEYVGTTIDTTERLQTEEHLRKAYERVDMLLESISDNFFGLDKEGRFTYFNKHAAEQMRTLGKDPDRLIGKVAWEAFPDMPNKDNFLRVLSERVVVVDELYYAPLGEWVENHMYPSNDGGLVIFQRYITERKRTEEELRRTQSELAHVTRVTTLGELTASIAHEVNQPLGAIVTNGHACLRLLSRNSPDIGEVREAVECMIADGIRASEVIKRIRGLLKKTRGGKSSYNINENIREVLALTTGELTKNEVTVRTELADALPYVVADRVQIQQVVLNLVLNSKESMSGAGWRPRELLIRTEQTGTEIIVTVRDTGVGIDPRDRERAFEPFFTTKEGGLGLGLSISRTIIEAHGGRLWTTHRDNGHGTTFKFTLPAGENA